MFFFSSRRRHTRCALVTGVQTCALPISTDLPKQPVIFSKPPTTVIGPGQPVVHRADITQQLDWEVELAVVIGTAASRVAREDALKHVLDRKSVVQGKSVSVRVDLGGRRIIKKKNNE